MDSSFGDLTNQIHKPSKPESIGSGSSGDKLYKVKMEGDGVAKHNGLANHGTSNHVSSMNHVGGGDKSGESKHQSHGGSSKHHKDGSHKHHSSHKSSSSSSKHKDGSSHKSRDGHSSSSSKEKHHHSSSHKHKDGSSSHKSSSSSGKEHKSSSSSSHKDKEHKSSSSGHKEHKSSSSSHKEHKSSSSGSHKEHKSSSSSKEHKSSSSSQKTGSSKPQDASPSHKPAKEGSKPSGEAKDRQDGAPTLVLKKSPDGKISVKTEHTEPAYTPKVKTEPESPVKKKVKEEVESDDDIPLSARTADMVKAEPTTPVKAEKRPAEDSDEDAPLFDRAEKAKKQKIKEKVGKKRKNEDDDEEKPLAKKKKKKAIKEEQMSSPQKGRKKKKEESSEKWKWWEELDNKGDDKVKWTFLEHKGPVFAPDYEPLPRNVRFYYEGHEMRLSKEAEEVATFYGRMLEHDYTTKDVFNKNFMRDWRKVMTEEERKIITDIKMCNFRDICEYFKEESEKRKNRSKDEKQKLKEENAALVEEYGFCVMDGHKEKIGNFKIEPPGLFRGRGDHPKQGMLKTRTQPEDVIINCSKDSQIPVPPSGHHWKKVIHDNTVSWLASWNENIQGSTKYVMLNASSKLKGIKDFQKYETARKLYKHVDRIRAQYHQDFKSKEMRIRQRAVALYFIDKLALRAGNEKDEGETADTVGCCSLRVEHIKLHEKQDDMEFVVEFDFLGKDSIRYQNSCPVEKRVFKNLQLFMENKNEGDDLFDRLNTAILNKHLNSLMEGLTAKVFRTFNASRTLQEQLKLLTKDDDPVAAKMLSYNRANRAVAVLCNHQRAVPKNFSKQMENIQAKIDQKKAVIKDAKKQVKAAKTDFKKTHNQKDKIMYERKKKQLERLEEQLVKLEVQQTDKDENKQIALGTSKLNYLDPRISVAWCKKHDVPIEKIYNKTQRDKFAWAIEMVDEDFEF